jgi:hypothetical protein
MKRSAWLLLLLPLFSSFAQTTPPAAAEKPPEYGWKNTLVAGLNFNQVSFQNWAQGGVNSIAWAFLSNGKFVNNQESFTHVNNLKINYGQTKLGSRDFEKTDDELYLESILSYKLGWVVDPYAAVTVRTQFTPGYKDSSGVMNRTSGFFDPGYLMQSVGCSYSPSDIITTRLGVAFKETFTSQYSWYGYADNPKTPERDAFRFQTGIESGTALNLPVMENILLTSQLNLFSAFDHLDVWDVRWDNALTGKVNNYVNVSLLVQVLHEVAQTKRTQMKQALAIGLTYSIF